jgi:hypothetical protein
MNMEPMEHRMLCSGGELRVVWGTVLVWGRMAVNFHFVTLLPTRQPVSIRWDSDPQAPSKVEEPESPPPDDAGAPRTATHPAENSIAVEVLHLSSLDVADERWIDESKPSPPPTTPPLATRSIVPKTKAGLGASLLHLAAEAPAAILTGGVSAGPTVFCSKMPAAIDASETIATIASAPVAQPLPMIVPLRWPLLYMTDSIGRFIEASVNGMFAAKTKMPAPSALQLTRAILAADVVLMMYCFGGNWQSLTTKLKRLATRSSGSA